MTLEEEIARSGLSLNQFSARAGVSAATVSKIVSGQQRSATKATLAKLAAFTGREPWQLEMLGSDLPVDLTGLPEVASAAGVVGFDSDIEHAIDSSRGLSPKRKRWLKQCLEMALNSP